MKVAFLRKPEGRYATTPEVIAGMFAWENEEWKLYAPTALGQQIMNALRPIPLKETIEAKNGIITKVDGVLTTKDYDYVKYLNEILMWDLSIPYGVGKIESLKAAEFDRMKEVLQHGS